MTTYEPADRPEEHPDGELVVVLGGTGKTGRRVVARLRERGVPTRAASRSGTPPFDWADRTTWPAALAGGTAAYLSFAPDLAVPGAADAIAAVTALAVDAGVRRLVLLSGRGEEEAQRSEQVVRDAGVEWTILRSSWFSQNFSESFMLDAVRSGVVALPVGDVPEPFVDLEDVADVAVAALTESGHAGRLYELTGPRLLSLPDAVREVAAASGREVRFEPVPAAEYAGMLAEAGLPAAEVSLLTYLFTEVMDGRNAHLEDGVQRALGRPARDFRDYARAAAASGVWNG